MTQFVRTTLTIGVLLVCLFLAATWGWDQVTKPLPSLAEDDTSALCTETPVEKGQPVGPSEVTISVLNASKRQGLASRTMTAFISKGFNGGESANAPAGTKVAAAEIWTDDPDSPAVKLVSSWLGGAKVVQSPVSQVGVVVVVGDEFTKLSAGKSSVTATTDTTICSPLNDGSTPDAELS